MHGGQHLKSSSKSTTVGRMRLHNHCLNAHNSARTDGGLGLSPTIAQPMVPTAVYGCLPSATKRHCEPVASRPTSRFATYGHKRFARPCRFLSLAHTRSADSLLCATQRHCRQGVLSSGFLHQGAALDESPSSSRSSVSASQARFF